MTQPDITPFVTATHTLGEGPLWDADRHCLWWVDIEEQYVYRADADGQAVQRWRLPERVGFVLPQPDGSFRLGLKSGLHRAQLHDNGTAELERIDRIDTESEHIRLNDGCQDKAGIIYAGTMDMRTEEPLGNVYRYGPDGQRTLLASDFVCANGPGLSPDGQTLYLVETTGHEGRRQGIYTLPLDPDGAAGTETLLVDWSGHDGFPDGLSVAPDGTFWVGQWGGSTIRQFRPDGTLQRAIDLPVRNPTKVAIAPDGTLYVTSARNGEPDEQLTRYPLTGSVLKLTG